MYRLIILIVLLFASIILSSQIYCQYKVTSKDSTDKQDIQTMQILKNKIAEQAYNSDYVFLGKVIKIIDIMVIVLICMGVIFGTWRDLEFQKYYDRGLPQPGNLCLYDQAEAFLGGILGVWVGVTCIFRQSSLAKILGKTESFAFLFSSYCFGLLCLGMGISSFWNVFISNLPNCHSL